MFSAASTILSLSLIINQVVTPAPALDAIPTITLNDNQVVTTNTATVKITAATEGKEVEWVVFNARFDTPVSYDPTPGDPKSIRIYINRVEDTIIIFAYTASPTGKPSKAAKTVIQVTSPVPLPMPMAPAQSTQPIPVPVPKERPTVGHLTFVVNKTTPVPSNVINNNSLRKYLNDNNVKLYIIDSGSKAAEGINSALKLINPTNQTASIIVLQDNTTAANAIDGLLLSPTTTVDDILALVKQYTK